MAKTKRKQLAALAALKVTSPESPKKPIEEHQNGHCPSLNVEPCDKSLPSSEVRQQRIIIWIPSSDPTPRLVNSRRFRGSGAPSRKRKRSIDNGEENIFSDAEDGHVYKKYAKIIFKLDNWNSKKSIDAPPPLDPPPLYPPPLDAPPLNAPPPNAEKSYQRRKTDSHVLCKERVLSVLTVNTNLPASSSVPARKKTKTVDKDQHLPRSLSGGDGENANDLAPVDSTARIPDSAQFSRRLSSRTRKTSSHKDLVFAKPGRQELRPEQAGVLANRKIIINPPRKFVTASEKEVDTSPEKTREKASSISTRQKTKLLKDTLLQHEQSPASLEVTSHPEDQRKLRSAEKLSDPESSAVGVRNTAQLSKGVTDLKRNSKSATKNTAGLGTPKTSTEPTNDDLEIATHSDSPSYWKGTVSVDRPSSKMKNSSWVSEVKLMQTKSSLTSEKQNEVVPLHRSVLRIRKRGLNQTGRSTLTASETNSVQKLAALDDFVDAALGLGRLSAIEPVRNSENSARMPLVDELNELHHGSDVVTSSNNAALNSRSRRISFLGRQAGTSDEELKRVSLGLNVQRGNTSHVNSVIRQGGNHLKLQSRLYGSHVRNHVDVTARVRSKLEEVGGVTEWLIGGGLGVFVDLFQERKIEEGDLLCLTMSSLKEIGVHAVGPRRKLIWMIEHLL